jgi:hypothetical protein
MQLARRDARGIPRTSGIVTWSRSGCDAESAPTSKRTLAGGVSGVESTSA